jgi:hypothetical protein
MVRALERLRMLVVEPRVRFLRQLVRLRLHRGLTETKTPSRSDG